MKSASPDGGPVIRALLHVRRDPAFGLPGETVPVHVTLRDDFARTADQARRKILDMVGRGQEFSLEGRGGGETLDFQPDQVVLVATWEEG